MNKDIFIALKSFSHDHAIIAFMRTCKSFYAYAQNFVIDARVPIFKINDIPNFYQVDKYEGSIDDEDLSSCDRCLNLRFNIWHNNVILPEFLTTLKLNVCDKMNANYHCSNILPHLRVFKFKSIWRTNMKIIWSSEHIFSLQFSLAYTVRGWYCNTTLTLPEQIRKLTLKHPIDRRHTIIPPNAYLEELRTSTFNQMNEGLYNSRILRIDELKNKFDEDYPQLKRLVITNNLFNHI